MFTLYEAVPQMVNAFHYSHDLPVATAVKTLTNSGLFTEVTEDNGVITLSRNGSDYKLHRGTVVVLHDTDNFSLIDDITFFSQYAELITVEASEFENLVERVNDLEAFVKAAKETAEKPAKETAEKPVGKTTEKSSKKVEKELDPPAATE